MHSAASKFRHLFGQRLGGNIPGRQQDNLDIFLLPPVCRQSGPTGTPCRPGDHRAAGIRCPDMRGLGQVTSILGETFPTTTV
ncbi:MAG: hypothetical protein WCH43_14855, partial [Verrucomicrobiota bacterium]